MIRLLVKLTVIFSLTFFAACGGGGDDKAPPPVPPSAANKQQDFNDLMAQANKMKSSCTNDLTPMFMMIATTSQAPGANQAQMMQMMPMLMAQNSQDQCKNDLMNFLMALNTIQVPGYGPYANHPYGKEYAKAQIVAVMNGVYGRINAEFQARGVQLTPQQQMALQQDLLAAAQVYSVTMLNNGSLGPYADPLRSAAGV